MEINKYRDIMGVVTCESIAEGRFVLLTANIVAPYGFGSRADLPGVIRPKTSTQAADAKYLITWIVPNQSLPMYIPSPGFPFALRRGGFDQSPNLPLTGATVHLTWPGTKQGLTIPSGSLALAFAGGVFTVPSGRFIYHVGMRTPGSYIVAADDATDGAGTGGLPKYSAAATNAVAIVERFNVAEWSLQIRLLRD